MHVTQVIAGCIIFFLQLLLQKGTSYVDMFRYATEPYLVEIFKERIEPYLDSYPTVIM